MKVALAVFFLLLQSCVCYQFSNSLTTVTAAGPKFNPTYVQTFEPLNSNILTTHPLNAPIRNPPTYWTDNVAYVVAMGPLAQATGNYYEGQTVIVRACPAPVNLNAATSQTPPEVAMYCVYDPTTVIGEITESSYGAAREGSHPGAMLPLTSLFLGNNKQTFLRSGWQSNSYIEKPAGKRFGGYGAR
jgi:hypothetical protein